jgi:hypothetical protein
MGMGGIYIIILWISFLEKKIVLLKDSNKIPKQLEVTCCIVVRKLLLADFIMLTSTKVTSSNRRISLLIPVGLYRPKGQSVFVRDRM